MKVILQMHTSVLEICLSLQLEGASKDGESRTSETGSKSGVNSEKPKEAVTPYHIPITSVNKNTDKKLCLMLIILLMM